MAVSDPDISSLIRRAGEGDKSAVEHLLALHRERLRRMVMVYMDTRLVARVDPSDVVQDALIEASQRLPDYLKERPLAFYPWLRQIAWQRLVHLQQHHLAQKRSVLREHRGELELSNESVVALASRLVAQGSSPSEQAIRCEMRVRVGAALDALSPKDRQVLVLRYLEQLSTAEAIQVIGITEAAFVKRHMRAIKRLRQLLDREPEES